MMGINAVEIRAEDLTISYDLLQATAERIEAVLQAAGARLGTGWAERLRRTLVHYLDFR